MKKLLLILFTFSSFSIAQALSADFTDTANHWSRQYATALRNNCNVQGYLNAQGQPLDLFKPDQSISRAELLKMALSCKSTTSTSSTSSSFSDVQEGSWYASFVYAAKNMGIVSGYPDNTFRPNNPVTRAEALKIILLSKDGTVPTTDIKADFSDVPTSAWYYSYLNYALSQKIIAGYSNNTFRPNNNLTRGEAAKIIAVTFGFVEAPTEPTPTPTPVPNGVSPQIAGCSIFPADNPWNQDISKLPVDRNSANYINSIGTSGHLHPDFGSPAEYGIPFEIADSSTPKVQVNTDYSEESDFGLAPIPASPRIEGTEASDGDRHVIVLDKSDCTLYETWSSYFENSVWNVGSSAKFDLSSNALRPDGWTSADAAGLPILPGLVRYDEAQAGEINHALRFTVNKTQKAYIHPATHHASNSTDANLPPMGLRLRLKANYDISGYTGASRVVLEALKKYGMIVADNGSNWFISGESNPNWDDEDLNQLKAVPGSAFEVVETGPLIK